MSLTLWSLSPRGNLKLSLTTLTILGYPFRSCPLSKPGFISSYPVYQCMTHKHKHTVGTKLYLVTWMSRIFLHLRKCFSTHFSPNRFLLLVMLQVSIQMPQQAVQGTGQRKSTCFANWHYASLCTGANSEGVTQPLSHSAEQIESGGAGLCNNKMPHDTISFLEEILHFFMRSYYNS